MSIFSELLPKINDISTVYINNFNKDLQAALQSFQKFEEEFQTQNGRSKTREKAQKDKNAMITLQSIDESEDESKKDAEPPKASRRGSKSSSAGSRSSGSERLAAKKRSKHEVEGLESPAQDKRQKRNASVKAQSIISKQVNVNLTQKMRRENSADIQPRQSSRSRRQKEGEKENVAPNLPVQIKQEKVSIPPEPEPMDMESVSLSVALSVPLSVKQETNPDDIAMPPPAIPVPKPRKAVLKEKPAEEPEVESSRRSRRTTRTKKQDALPPVPAARSTRSSSRVRAEPEPAPEPEARPKRTRGRKKVSEIRPDSGNGTQSSQESLPASPADKPRPKRTRRAQKADKEPKPVEPEPTVSPKEERPSTEQVASPVLSIKETKSMRNKKDTTQTIIDLDKTKESTKSNNSDKDSDNTKSNDKNTDILVKPSAKEKAAKAKQDKELAKEKVDKIFAKSKLEMAKAALDKETESKSEKDAIIDKSKSKANGLVKGNSVEKLAKSQSVDVADSAVLDKTQLLSKPAEMDQTMVLPNGVYNHAPVTPNNIHLNETVTLDKTMVLDKPNIVMDATVVLEKGPISNLTADTSLLTDDESQDDEIPATPPRKGAPTEQPASAVKEKVQQFEEMATRVTRTKTRAMAKKEDPKDESHTPPDKVSKMVLSSDTLSKMNSLIFNGKAPQSTSSACKPRAPAPAPACKVTASASKASSLSRWREAAAHDDTQAREDARAKKEALLEAKREQQKRKREEKMAAAAAARSAAERERRALQEAAARERAEKQLHADQERGERLKEVERKKQELARKAAETEERRRAEEAARHQRLAEEQRRALEQRRKQLEEQEAMKREEAKMSKEIEKKHREYLEKQKQKLKIDKMHTPFKTPGTPLSKYPPLPPAHMEDGFQYLDSDEDAEPPERPIPTWCSSKVRRARLAVQSLLKPTLVDRLFSVGVHSPDLAEIFPCMERARLKRTSSAVWHTPPPLPPCRE